MNRRGFALLSALWVIVLLAAATSAIVAAGRLDTLFSRNRVQSVRAGWAREACLELLLGRFAADTSVRTVDSTALGQGVWCRSRMEPAGVRVNVNLVDEELLRRIVQDESITDAILDWRDPDGLARPAGAEADWYRAAGRPAPRNGPLVNIAELRGVRGIDSAAYARLAVLLDVEGGAQVNLNGAPVDVLAALPGMTRIGAEAIASARELGRRFRGVEDLASVLSTADRNLLVGSLGRFLELTRYEDTEYMVTVEGFVAGTPIAARMRVMVTPVGRRLAVRRRELQ